MSTTIADPLHTTPKTVGIYSTSRPDNIARYVYDDGLSCLIEVVAVDGDDTTIRGLGYVIPSGEERTVPTSMIVPDDGDLPVTGQTVIEQEHTMTTAVVTAAAAPDVPTLKALRAQARKAGMVGFTRASRETLNIWLAEYAGLGAADKQTLAGARGAAAETDPVPVPDTAPAPAADVEPDVEPDPQVLANAKALTVFELKRFAVATGYTGPNKRDPLAAWVAVHSPADVPVMSAKAAKAPSHAGRSTSPNARIAAAQAKALEGLPADQPVCGRGFPILTVRGTVRCCWVCKTKGLGPVYGTTKES